MRLFGVDAVFLLTLAAISAFGAHTISRLRQQVVEARQLGQYRLGRRIGSGGMGDVYLAEHQLLKRPCAVKLIRPGELLKAGTIKRFEREVRINATLSHPNIVEIFDYGRTEDGVYYYVMEYLPGLSLAELVARHGPLPPERAVYLLRQVCLALHEAHEAGVIHRDIKPSNIFAARRGGRDDVAKLLDFGLVQPASTNLSADPSRVGQIVGTPLYISPEQATGERKLDARSDIYSLGAVAYFLLTGRPPFDEGSAIAALIAHARDQAAPPSRFRDGLPDGPRAHRHALPRQGPGRALPRRREPRAGAGRMCSAPESGTNIRPIVGGEREVKVAAKECTHKKTLVTRTPKSVSIKISSPRATSRPLDVSSTGAAAVAVELDDVAGLQVGQLGERQVDPAQLDGERDRHVEGAGGRGRAGRGAWLTHRLILTFSRDDWIAWSRFAQRARYRDERAGRPSRRPAESESGIASLDPRGRGSTRRDRSGWPECRSAGTRRAVRRRPSAAVSAPETWSPTPRRRRHELASSPRGTRRNDSAAGSTIFGSGGRSGCRRRSDGLERLARD